MQSLLMITSILGAENCAAALANQLAFLLRLFQAAERGSHAFAVMSTRSLSSMTRWPSPIRRGLHSSGSTPGLAVPLQINFAISGTARLVREVRAVLARREQEQALAMRAAAVAVESELRDTVTGLILNSQLALSEPALSPELSAKLKTVAELAGSLQQRLGYAMSQPVLNS